MLIFAFSCMVSFKSSGTEHLPSVPVAAVLALRSWAVSYVPAATIWAHVLLWLRFVPYLTLPGFVPS